MKQQVFVLVGISGVGKTTFLRRVREKVEFQHLSAGGLILNSASLDHKGRDELRFSDIDENQRLLVAEFERARDKSARRVVLDAHTVIETRDGIREIGTAVFEMLRIDGLMHLSSSPELILRNRINDIGRSRPQLSISEIAKNQATSLSAARRIAKDLRIPFCEVSADELMTTLHFMGKLKWAALDGKLMVKDDSQS
jgi:adenylate kinase